MIDNDDDFKWDGYDHLMSTKPTSRNDPKASIYDLNSVRDSVLFDKERFSFCLSPPKELNGQPKTIQNTKPIPYMQQPTPQVQHPVLKENMPNSLNVRMINTNGLKQNSNSMAQPQSIPTTKSQISPPLMSQKPTPSIPNMSPPKSQIQLSRVPSSPNIKSQPFNIKPNNNVKEPMQSLTDVSIEPLSNSVIRSSNNNQQQTSSLSTRAPTPTQQQPNKTLGIRPPTPTQQPSLTLAGSQSTPTKKMSLPLRGSHQPVSSINNNNSAQELATKSNQPQLQQASTNSVAVTEEQFTKQFDTRVKTLELENRLLKAQMSEKDKEVSNLNNRVNELEQQLNTFMDEIKLFLMNTMVDSDQMDQ